MRRAMALLLVLFSILSLGACGSQKESAGDAAIDVRSALLGSDIQFTAQVTADYGDRVYEFRLQYSSADSQITVLEPEIIKGVTIGVSESGTVLRYEGAELNTGALTQDGLSPISSLPVIVNEWRSGYISETYFEKLDGVDMLVMATTMPDKATNTTWFTLAGVPVKSEIISKELVVIRCEFEDVTIPGG